MRRISLIALAVAVAGCASGSADTTSSTEGAATTVEPGSTTTTQAAVDDCPAAPYDVGFLPVNVNDAGFDPSGLEPDVWTSVGGTHTTFYGRSDGTVAIALIRGTLPAVDWPGEKGKIEIDGTRAAVGPHPDGTWVAGWYEEPSERCNLYTMVFYPPWSPQDVENVLLSMNRVGG